MERWDMHCHLSFLPAETAVSSLGEDLRFYSCTVTYEDYAASATRFAGEPAVVVAAGLHPWYVSADEEEADVQAQAVCAAVGQTRAIGEVGLDFGRRHALTADAQVRAFRAIAARAAQVGDCVMSIHSVQATQAVLDVLDDQGFWAHGTAIFHWYSGSSQHLTAALSRGAYFSINPRMFQTKRGREYARTIPLSRLLLETDYPADDGTLPARFGDALDYSLDQLALLRGVSTGELARAIGRNTGKVLGLLLSGK